MHPSILDILLDEGYGRDLWRNREGTRRRSIELNLVIFCTGMYGIASPKRTLSGTPSLQSSIP